MPRVPAGFHRQTGSGLPGAGRPQRYTATSQRQYWRHTTSQLHAGATAVQQRNNLFHISQFAATVGPAGVGEKWQVDLVQVQASSQYQQAPLVIQQQNAQSLATTSSQPPPIVAQVWRRVGGVNIYLLAQSSNGGNDDLAVSCPVLSAGEAISVVWFGPPVTDNVWFTLTGTRYVVGVG